MHTFLCFGAREAAPSHTYNEWADGNGTKLLSLSPDQNSGRVEQKHSKLSCVSLFVIHTKEPLRTSLILWNSPAACFRGTYHFLPRHHPRGTLPQLATRRARGRQL